MNIFVLNQDPKVSAELMCDKHVVKMILESAQMLCSPFPNGDAPYKRTHFNHPCSKWIRESANNYEWLLSHAYGLVDEYFDRYSKIHKSPFAQAMPDEYKNKDAVVAYQTYYINDKKYFAKWKNREMPEFMFDSSLLVV